MVAPLIAAAAPAALGLGARALGALGLDSVGGVIGGLAGSFIPGIIDALVSSKSKEEAAQALAPMRQSKIAELVGRGVRRDEASAQVDEEMQSAVQEEMQKGSLPAWAEMALGLVGGIAGAKLGSKLGKKPMVKADAPEVKAEAPIAKTKGELPAVDDPPQGIVSPFGPKPAPRKGTPIDPEMEPQTAITAPTGLREMDDELADMSTLRRPFAPPTAY